MNVAGDVLFTGDGFNESRSIGAFQLLILYQDGTGKKPVKQQEADDNDSDSQPKIVFSFFHDCFFRLNAEVWSWVA